MKKEIKCENCINWIANDCDFQFRPGKDCTFCAIPEKYTEFPPYKDSDYAAM
jgi:hypothetical protein